MSTYFSAAGPRFSLSVGVSSPPANKKKQKNTTENNTTEQAATKTKLVDERTYAYCTAQEALQASGSGAWWRKSAEGGGRGEGFGSIFGSEVIEKKKNETIGLLGDVNNCCKPTEIKPACLTFHGEVGG